MAPCQRPKPRGPGRSPKEASKQAVLGAIHRNPAPTCSERSDRHLTGIYRPCARGSRIDANRPSDITDLGRTRRAPNAALVDLPHVTSSIWLPAPPCPALINLATRLCPCSVRSQASAHPSSRTPARVRAAKVSKPCSLAPLPPKTQRRSSDAPPPFEALHPQPGRSSGMPSKAPAGPLAQVADSTAAPLRKGHGGLLLARGPTLSWTS